MEGNHIFYTEYSKKGKPTGRRSMEIISNTFEEALYQFMLPYLCEKVHGHDWWHNVLKDGDIICHKESNVSAYYSVLFKNEKKVICEYKVEMEVIATRHEVINDPEAAPNRK